MSSRELTRLAAMALCTALVYSATAEAQGTGRIRGRVVDEGDTPLPGAVISVSSPTGSTSGAGGITQITGEYQISGLAPGSDYIVKAEFPGYATVEQAAGELSSGGSIVVNFRLVPSERLTEEIEVFSEGDVVDTESTVTETSFSEEFIESLPILGRNYQDLLSLAPGVTDTDGDGAPNVHGSRARSFQVQIGGINVSNPFSGRGTDFDLNMEAVEEVEIITSGASAEFTRGEGFANIITKSGSNEFEGAFKLFYRSDILDNDGAGFNQTIPNFEEFVPETEFTNYFPFLSLGGAIKKDKLWYFLSNRYDHQEIPENIGTDVQVRKIDFLEEQGKLTWQVTTDHKLALEVIYNPTEGRNLSPFGFASGIARESLLNVDATQTLYTLRESAIFTPTILLESTLAYLDFATDNFPVRDPSNPNEPVVLNTANGTYTGPYNRTDTSSASRLVWREALSWFIDDFIGTGQHDLRMGFSFEGDSYHQDNNVRPFQFDIFSNEIQGEEQGAADPNPAFTLQDRPRPNIYSLRARSKNYGIYFQDDWKPLPNLTIGIGLRYDIEDISAPGREPFDPLAERLLIDPNLESLVPTSGDLSGYTRHPLDIFNPFLDDQCLVPDEATGEFLPFCPKVLGEGTVDVQDRHFSPRFSISWDPFATGKTKVFGTYGRFYDKIFLEAIVQDSEPAIFTESFQFTPDGDPLLETGIVDPPTLSLVDRNIRTPYVDEFTIGFERELIPEVSISVTYINRNGRDQLQDVDLNHRALGTDEFGEVTRLVEEGCEPNQNDPNQCRPEIIPIPDGLEDLATNSVFFNQVFQIGNFNQSSFEAVEVQVTKRLHRNWQLDGSYTWSKARGDAEDFQQILGDDPADIQDSSGFLSFDQRHVIKGNWISYLPQDFQLGSTIQWESGLPYSIVIRDISLDQFNTSQFRQVFPTGARNDQRNSGRWLFNAALRKTFNIGKIAATASLEAENLLNSDDLTIFFVESVPQGSGDINADEPTIRNVRRFGRRWQVGFEFKF